MGASAGTVEETAGSVAGTGSPLVLEVESKVKGTVCSQLSDISHRCMALYMEASRTKAARKGVFFSSLDC